MIPLAPTRVAELQAAGRLPNRAVETYFGPVFGRDAINTSAAATAEAVLTSNDRIIPELRLATAPAQ